MCVCARVLFEMTTRRGVALRCIKVSTFLFFFPTAKHFREIPLFFLPLFFFYFPQVHLDTRRGQHEQYLTLTSLLPCLFFTPLHIFLPILSFFLLSSFVLSFFVFFRKGGLPRETGCTRKTSLHSVIFFPGVTYSRRGIRYIDKAGRGERGGLRGQWQCNAGRQRQDRQAGAHGATMGGRSTDRFLQHLFLDE